MRLRALPALFSVSFGVLLGLGAVTFDYAEGLSYLSSDPQACANCHIMHPQYDAWQKSSHHTMATCADCHLPATFPGKYVVKGLNGWNHSKAFTLQDFAEPIYIKELNADVLHANCLRCHAPLVHDQSSSYTVEAPRCVRCHVTVGHGDQVGLGGPMRAREADETEEP